MQPEHRNTPRTDGSSGQQAEGIAFLLPEPLRVLVTADVRDIFRRGSPVRRKLIGSIAAYIEIIFVFIAAPLAALGIWRNAILCATIAFVSGCVASYCYPGAVHSNRTSAIRRWLKKGLPIVGAVVGALAMAMALCYVAVATTGSFWVIFAVLGWIVLSVVAAAQRRNGD